MKKFINIAAVLVSLTAVASVASAAEYQASCQVKFPNGYVSTAKCGGGTVAVVTAAKVVQCVPKGAINAEGKVILNRKDPGQNVTPCRDGMDVVNPPEAKK